MGYSSQGLAAIGTVMAGQESLTLLPTDTPPLSTLVGQVVGQACGHPKA